MENIVYNNKINIDIVLTRIYDIFGDENFKDWSSSDLFKKKIKINNNETCSFKSLFEKLNWNEETTTIIFDSLYNYFSSNNVNIKSDYFYDIKNKYILMNIPGIKLYFSINNRQMNEECGIECNNTDSEYTKHMQLNYESFILLCKFLIMMGKEELVRNESYATLEKEINIFSKEDNKKINFYNILKDEKYDVSYLNKQGIQDLYTIIKDSSRCFRFGIQRQNKVLDFIKTKNISSDEKINNAIDNLFKNQEVLNQLSFYELKIKLNEIIKKFDIWDIDNVNLKSILFKSLYNNLNKKLSSKDNILNIECNNIGNVERIFMNIPGSGSRFIINNHGINKIENFPNRGCQFISKEFNNESLMILCKFLTMMRIESSKNHIPNDLKKLMILDSDNDRKSTKYTNKVRINDRIEVIKENLNNLKIQDDISNKIFINSNISNIMNIINNNNNINYLSDIRKFNKINVKSLNDELQIVQNNDNKKLNLEENLKIMKNIHNIIDDIEKMDSTVDIDNNKRINFYNILNNTDDVCYLDENDWKKFQEKKLELTSDEIQMLKYNQEVQKISNQEKKINKPLNFSSLFLEFMKKINNK